MERRKRLSYLERRVSECREEKTFFQEPFYRCVGHARANPMSWRIRKSDLTLLYSSPEASPASTLSDASRSLASRSCSARAWGGAVTSYYHNLGCCRNALSQPTFLQAAPQVQDQRGTDAGPVSSYISLQTICLSHVFSLSFIPLHITPSVSIPLHITLSISTIIILFFILIL